MHSSPPGSRGRSGAPGSLVRSSGPPGSYRRSSLPPGYDFRWLDTSDPTWWKSEIPAAYTVEEFAAEFELATHVFQKMLHGRRFVYVSDFSLVSTSDPRNRARVGQFLRDCSDSIKQHMIAWGIVAPRPLMRGAITAVTWLGHFPVSTQVFAERRECDEWLAQQLACEQLARERV